MGMKAKVVADPRREAEFDRAFELLQQLVDLSEADRRQPLRENAVYTTSAVLWLLVCQRLNPDSSLEAAVKRLIESQPSLLPLNKRVTHGTLSSNTGAYSRARSRLSPEVTRWFAQAVSQSLIDATPPAFAKRRVYIVDGTTLALSPEPALLREFPAATNQFGAGAWPIAQVVVAHELDSGTALLPEVSAKFGPHAVSETALIGPLLEQMPTDGIVLADSGFGIYAVAWQVRQTQRDFVFRLTEQRFNALRRCATVVSEDAAGTTYSLTWRPSVQERRKHAHLPADAVLEVRLHAQRITDSLTLLLVTSLPHSGRELSELYRRRSDVETDLRNIKIVLATEQIRARSVDMFHKELLMSLVAYNLLIQFRRQAAAVAQVPTRQLSFKRTWTTFSVFLLRHMHTDPVHWREQYRTALGYAALDKLPHRPHRSYEREAYQRRPKSAQFKKRTPKKPDKQPDH